jgi:hypothetical protein
MLFYLPWFVLYFKKSNNEWHVEVGQKWHRIKSDEKMYFEFLAQKDQQRYDEVCISAHNANVEVHYAHNRLSLQRASLVTFYLH